MADARRYHDLPSPFAMKRGGQLHGARVAYESWGELNAARDNAVLILTGLSPSAHAAANRMDRGMRILAWRHLYPAPA